MPKAFRLFLQGGFAKCYELVDTETQEVFAGKIVPKSILLKPHHREKVHITHFRMFLCCTEYVSFHFLSLKSYAAIIWLSKPSFCMFTIVSIVIITHAKLLIFREWSAKSSNRVKSFDP